MPTVLQLVFMVLVANVLQYSFPQETIEPWVHLSTLWDAPGNIEDISPDSRYAIISQDDYRIQRVVAIATGDIVATVENGGFDFSPTGRYLIERSVGSDSIIRDFDTGVFITVEGNLLNFLAEEQFVHTSLRDEAMQYTIHRLVDVTTGEITAEYDGNVSFSEDGRLAALTSFNEERTSTTTQLIEIATGAILDTYNYDSPRQGMFGVRTQFHADNRLLSIWHIAGTVKMIDIATGKLLYENRFGFYFSPDWRYVVTGNGDNLDVEVQLMEASTGRILDRVVGIFNFSPDSRYVFRSEVVSFDVYHTEMIDLETYETLFETEGRFSFARLVSEDVIESAIYFFPKYFTRYYDLLKGELIYIVEGSATRYDDVLVFWQSPFPYRTLQMWQSQNIVAYGTEIEVAPNRQYALVSNGLFVDVYGSESSRSALTPPRPPQGVARIEAGEIYLYPAPNASQRQEIAESTNMLNPTNVFVLGQAEQGAWLFVKFDYRPGSFAELQIATGWIPSDDVSEIESWADVPVLDADQPLETLRTLAYQ